MHTKLLALLRTARDVATVVLTTAALAVPAYAQTAELEGPERDANFNVAPSSDNSDRFLSALDGALRACEMWVLDPKTHLLNAEEKFLENLNMGDKVAFVDSLPEPLLPPPPYRKNNHYLNFKAPPANGFYLVVSDRIPMCHITGGGQENMLPTIENYIASDSFLMKWSQKDSMVRKPVMSTLFQNNSHPKFQLILSRPDSFEGGNTVQLQATAQLVIEDKSKEEK